MFCLKMTEDFEGGKSGDVIRFEDVSDYVRYRPYGAPCHADGTLKQVVEEVIADSVGASDQ